MSSCGGSAIIGLGNLNWDQLAGTTGKGKIYWEKMIMGWFGGDDDDDYDWIIIRWTLPSDRCDE